ncbi:tRNA/rRNA methyltransferase [Erwinia amylovora]
MNDEFKGKSGKVKVMYVRGDDENSKGGQNPRTGKGGPRQDGSRRPSRNADSKPRGGRDRDVAPGDSPWRTVSRAPSALAGGDDKPDHGGISGKSYIDPEQIRRQRMEETRVYGENACQALFQSRPECIVRAWFVQEVTPRFREALKWMAANRKAYHVVDEAELAKASGTEHHGGVCFLIKKRSGMPVSQWLSAAGEKDCVLALEQIGNPHNLGGMMRSCAHFGAKGVLVDDASLLESGAAVRTAEGGAEHVQAISGESFEAGLNAFRKAGYTIVTTSSHKGTPLAQATLPAKTVLVLGQESDGLSDSVWQQGDLSISIGGTGNVESLNVSVATGILLAEWWRQNA